MVDDGHARGRRARCSGDEAVGADVEAGHEPLEAAVGAQGEGAGDVAAVVSDADQSEATPAGMSMATSASPAEMRSARLDSTSIFSLPSWARAVLGATQAVAMTATNVARRTLMESPNARTNKNVRVPGGDFSPEPVNREWAVRTLRKPRTDPGDIPSAQRRECRPNRLSGISGRTHSSFIHGRSRTRTGDPLLVRQVL